MSQAKAPRVWQRMLSGRRLNLIEPSALDIELEDIAHGLARVARWNGQTVGSEIFSVAQHSLLVEKIACLRTPFLSHEARLATLLHDAPEYVIGDMISPFKAVIGTVYKDVEKRLLDAVLQRFSIKPLNSLQQKLLKQADSMAAYFEATMLAGFSNAEAQSFFGKPDVAYEGIAELLQPQRCQSVQTAFVTYFNVLMQERQSHAG